MTDRYVCTCSTYAPAGQADSRGVFVEDGAPHCEDCIVVSTGALESHAQATAFMDSLGAVDDGHLDGEPRRCGNCHYCQPSSRDPSKHECWVDPPGAHVLAMPVPKSPAPAIQTPNGQQPQGMGIAVEIIRYRPPTSVDEYCERWYPKPQEAAPEE